LVHVRVLFGFLAVLGCGTAIAGGETNYWLKHYPSQRGGSFETDFASGVAGATGADAEGEFVSGSVKVAVIVTAINGIVAVVVDCEGFARMAVSPVQPVN
jgi:hypothetical protein